MDGSGSRETSSGLRWRKRENAGPSTLGIGRLVLVCVSASGPHGVADWLALAIVASLRHGRRPSGLGAFASAVGASCTVFAVRLALLGRG